MRAAFVWLALLVAIPGQAAAQAYQCRIPTGPISVPTVQQNEPARRVPITGYTLSLTWSPEYCRGRENRAADSLQCSGHGGRFGFVAHGLWPEGRGSNWPQWCPAARALTSRELARNLCMTPSAGLLANEWAKHGACMAQRPETYFHTQRALWNSLRWPDFDRLSRDDTLTVGAIRQAFADANPRWRPADVGVGVNERGWLTELRLCYNASLRPVACDVRRKGPRDSSGVTIWRGL
ncbi:MAG: ribonuclease T [Croceibacterium sp.]